MIFYLTILGCAFFCARALYHFGWVLLWFVFLKISMFKHSKTFHNIGYRVDVNYYD